jgi:hypothetical protein
MLLIVKKRFYHILADFVEFSETFHSQGILSFYCYYFIIIINTSPLSHLSLPSDFIFEILLPWNKVLDFLPMPQISHCTSKPEKLSSPKRSY